MNIYSSVDGNNIDKIIALFNSVYINTNNKNLKFYLIIDKFPKELPHIPEYLNGILNIKEINFNEKWEELLSEFNTYFYKLAKWCKNRMNFARFIFFKVFPEVDRVIYLDWDMIVLEDIYKLSEDYNDKENMIVCKCSGENLFNNVFDSKFKCSTNYRSLYAKTRKEKIKNHTVGKVLDYLKISYEDFFKTTGFNAGFYIVSKEHFNDEFIFNHVQKLINVQKRFMCFNFGTQVVMNLMNIKNRKFIDKKWNHLPILDSSINNLDNLYIIHWNGKDKPWNSVAKENEIWFDYYLKVYPDFKDRNFIKNINEFSKTDEPKKIVKKYKRINNNSNILKLLQNKI
tara:strand:- start:374 stop:1399 length:1026 start_codon:yes stop_codon:yes gene_type:complete